MIPLIDNARRVKSQTFADVFPRKKSRGTTPFEESTCLRIHAHPTEPTTCRRDTPPTRVQETHSQPRSLVSLLSLFVTPHEHKRKYTHTHGQLLTHTRHPKPGSLKVTELRLPLNRFIQDVFTTLFPHIAMLQHECTLGT